MKKILVTLFALLPLLWNVATSAQSLVFHLIDGSTTEIELSSAFRMSTVGNKTIVSHPDGSTKEFTQSDILTVTYRETRGDVNRDNAVDVADIATIISIMAGKTDNPLVDIYNRTVLVYIAGDNNLSELSLLDLREIMEGSKELSTKNKLIVFVDNAKEKPYFLQVEQEDTLRLKTMETEMNTSDPNTLYNAMKYVTDNYAAESYGLVLWGHADGWILRENAKQTGSARSQSVGRPRRAFGMDYTGGRTWMNIPDMAKALGSLPRLKFIFADCCLFMCVEDVYELRNCADYIIGPTAEIPAVGAPYQTVVPALFSQDSTFYENIVSRYYEQMSGGFNVPLAAVKTSELESLAQATAATMATFAGNIEADDDGCRYPNTDSLIYYYNHTQFDMQDFIMRYACEKQYNEWKRVFDSAVPYHTFSKVWIANYVLYADQNYAAFKDFTPTKERMGGLGMFLPQRDSDAANWNYVTIKK